MQLQSLGPVLSDQCGPVAARPVALPLCCAQLTPICESSSTVELEIGTTVKVTLLVEMVVD